LFQPLPDFGRGVTKTFRWRGWEVMSDDRRSRITPAPTKQFRLSIVLAWVGSFAFFWPSDVVVFSNRLVPDRLVPDRCQCGCPAWIDNRRANRCSLGIDFRGHRRTRHIFHLRHVANGEYVAEELGHQCRRPKGTVQGGVIFGVGQMSVTLVQSIAVSILYLRHGR